MPSPLPSQCQVPLVEAKDKGEGEGKGWSLIHWKFDIVIDCFDTRAIDDVRAMNTQSARIWSFFYFTWRRPGLREGIASA